MKTRMLISLSLLSLCCLLSVGAAQAYLVPYHPGMFANVPEPPQPPPADADDPIVELIQEWLDEETGEITRVFVTRSGKLIYEKFGLYNGSHTIDYPYYGPYDDRGDIAADSDCDYYSDYGCGY